MKTILFLTIVVSLSVITSCTTSYDINSLTVQKESGFHDKLTTESESYMNKAIAALDHALPLMNPNYGKNKIARIKKQLFTYIKSELDITDEFIARAEGKMEQEGILNKDKFLVYEAYQLIDESFNKVASKLPKESVSYLEKFVSEYVKSVIYSQDDPNDYMQFYRAHITAVRAHLYCSLIVIIEEYYN